MHVRPYLLDMRRLCQKIFRYFPAEVVSSTPLDNSKPYLFCSHPHGVASIHHVLALTDGAGILSEHHTGERRHLAATPLFYIPFVRELTLALGCVDAGRESAEQVLKKGWSLWIVLGGEKEQVLTTQGKHIIALEDRKGKRRGKPNLRQPAISLTSYF